MLQKNFSYFWAFKFKLDISKWKFPLRKQDKAKIDEEKKLINL